MSPVSPTSTVPRVPPPPVEAPLTLVEPAPPTLGLRDTAGLWANLGVSLLLPVAAAFVVLPGRPLGVTLLAVAVGAVLGSVLLGLTAAPAARERVPAMVLLRYRASYLPTALSVLRCVGWATFEVVVIAEAASRALGAPRWPFVLLAGGLATAMALRPLGAVRVVLGTAGGYGLATFGMFTLGVLALAAYSAAGLDVIDALLAVPFGLLAVLVLATVEVDEAFANVYSTALSAQNVAPRVDRRVLALAVGATATLLVLVLDVVAYEPFLFLLGAVLVPLAGVLVVAYPLRPRGSWDVSDTAPARPALLLPWAAGSVAYQLTVPTFLTGLGAGWTAWWAARQADLGILAAFGLSASLVSLTVASLLTVAVALPGALRDRRGVRP